MRLLTLPETEVERKEGVEKLKAQEIAREVIEITKKFNQVKTALENNEKVLEERHREFVAKIDQERKGKEDELEELTRRCKTALEPLYQKEVELLRKADDLEEKEEWLEGKKREVHLREVEVKKIEEKLYGDMKKTENERIALKGEREKLVHDQNYFKTFQEMQNKLLKQSQQKIREFLEKERAKFRK